MDDECLQVHKMTKQSIIEDGNYRFLEIIDHYQYMEHLAIRQVAVVSLMVK